MKRIIDSRYWVMMVLMFITILSYIPGVCISGDTEPTPTPEPTPEPTPTACCGEGYHQEATYADVKVGPLGVMTEVILSGPICVQWNYPQTATYSASGGNDRDVCVRDDGLGAYEYDVDEDFIWICVGGYQDPNNPRQFIFAPPEPSEPDYCDFYNIYVMADDTGSCNVGDEWRDKSKFVQVWKKFRKWEEDYKIFTIWVQKAGEPGIIIPVGVGCHVWSYYWCENGDITAEEQDMKIEWNGLYNVIVNATHTFKVPGGVNYTSTMEISGGSPQQGNIELSSYDTHSFAYDYYTSMGGLKSEFYAFVDLSMGGTGGHGDVTVNLSLSAPKCCDD